MRSDLKLDMYGDFDESTYATSVPEEEWDDSVTEGVKEGVYQLPYAFDDNGNKNPSVWDEEGYIVKSCVIGKTGNDDRFAVPGSIKIKANNEIWIVLKNVDFSEGDGIDYTGDNLGGDRIICNTDKGTVKFLIDGELYVQKGAIIKEGFKNNCEVSPSSRWGIEYYGTRATQDPDDEDNILPAASISCINNVTFCGTFMCPTTTISANVAGLYNVWYTDEYGVRRNLAKPIIGSALFEKVTNAANEFGVLNSGGGGVDTNVETVNTVCGTFEISYFMGI